MAKHPEKFLLLPVLLFTLVLAPTPAAADHDHPSPQPYPASVACKTAQDQLAKGDLDQAKAILTTLPRPGEDPCVVDALAKLDQQREAAAQQVLAGQKQLRSGDLDGAGNTFDKAQQADRSNQDAAAGLAEVLRLEKDALPTAASNWQYFYDEWVSPISRLLLPVVIGVLVLMLASSLVSRFLVRPASTAWPKPQRYLLNGVGAVLLVGTSVLLPVHVMFKPFKPGPPLSQAGGTLVLSVALLVVVLVATVARFLKRQDTKRNGEDYKPGAVWRDWARLLIALGALLLLGLVLWLSWLPRNAPDQLHMVFAMLVVMAILLTSAGLGQNLRLQIEAQGPDGTASAASTDYILARMLTLGDEHPRNLQVALSQSSLSALQSETLSALPTGTIVSTLSRLFYTLRPDLTWRARVTEVDCNRISVTLIRNGRHAESIIFSRQDCGLPPLNDNASAAAVKTAKARAHAQLLTGAAAFILVHLSKVHRELRGDLSGARNWKSVTLQVIAGSGSLMDADAQQAVLLAQAVNEDPGHLAARFDYLLAAFLAKPVEAREYTNFVKAVLHCMTETDCDQELLAAAPQLNIRVRYTCAGNALAGYLASYGADDEALNIAEAQAEKLTELCRPKPKAKEQETSYAQQMRPFAANLHQAVQLLRGRATDSGHPHEAARYSPRLSWDHAVLESCLKLSTGNPSAADYAVQDLRFALLTEEDRSRAGKDPRFQPFMQDPGFRRLVGLPQETLLDLPQFAGHRAYLKERGMGDPDRLATATKGAGLARQLNIPVTKVAEWHDLAGLAGLHPSLNDRQLLELLLGLGVTDPATLRDRIDQGRKALVHALRDAAEQAHLTSHPGVVNPLPWMEKAAEPSD